MKLQAVYVFGGEQHFSKLGLAMLFSVI